MSLGSGKPRNQKMIKKVTLSPFGDPPPLTFGVWKSAQIATNAFSRQNSVCLESWLSLRSFTIVDYQSQILHIKPPYLQECTQIRHFVINLLRAKLSLLSKYNPALAKVLQYGTHAEFLQISNPLRLNPQSCSALLHLKKVYCTKIEFIYRKYSKNK